MARASLEDEIAAVRAICRDVGLGEVAPALLKAAHHTTLLIPGHVLVARVQSAGPIDLARARAARELAVARHLADRAAPVAAPAAGLLAGPHVVASAVVTLWHHVADARVADEADSGVAAATLAALHRGLRDYPGALPPYTRTLDRCRRALDGIARSSGLAEADRTLLADQFRRLRGEIDAASSEWVPLHGDSHPGNLLVGEAGPHWIDFEDACRGPRALDIASLPRAAWPLFADADPALVARFADLKSVCVAIWCHADIARSAEIREAADYHLERVRRMAV